MSFRKVALPFLTKLHHELKETILLGVLRDTEVLAIETLSLFHRITFRSQVGMGEPLYCTGIGKALLANLKPELQDEIIKKIHLKKHTDRTINRAKDLHRELSVIRQQGYAIDDEEVEEGVKCVAAPILGSDGYAVASFSVPGPKKRIEAHLDVIKEKVVDTSRRISAGIGYLDPGT
jgi:DNA-binding IclR family transcriptional regulator